MNGTWSLRQRVEPSSLTAILAVGDLVGISIFVVLGELSHGYTVAGNPGRVLGTLAPFVLGWVLVSVAGNLYTTDAIADLRSAVVWTLLAWGLAVVVAQALRSTSFFHGNAAVTFALVSFAVGGALLVTWRLLVTLLR